ncbi:MAG TPA: nucleotide exchange factor GrpE [bacterium]|nr:nucleotide exchange factor GrpE [bacterium]
MSAQQPQTDAVPAGEQPQVETPEPEAPSAPPADDWKDKYLRLAAEWDNFKKRSARDFNDLIRGAERDLIGDLTEVYDDFVRALEADHKAESGEQFAQGIGQIKAKFWTVLEKRGLERMETIGKPFNPEEHDALMRLPSEEYDEGIVMQEVAPGYRLGGKILRHAKVVVSQGKPAEEKPEQ